VEVVLAGGGEHHAGRGRCAGRTDLGAQLGLVSAITNLIINCFILIVQSACPHLPGLAVYLSACLSQLNI
jgi:hypothetical protein